MGHDLPRRSSAVATVILAAALCFTTIARARSQTVLYDSGPANGDNNAWTISFGYSAADSFVLSGPSTLSAVNFSVWNSVGDVTTDVDWAILTNIGPNASIGTMVASGTANVSSAYQYTNASTYDINVDTIALQNVSLAPGEYWLELSNANASNPADPVFWDINGGPSQVWDSYFGYDPAPGTYAIGLSNASDSFQILGTDPEPVPEPASAMVFGSGLLGIGLALRRKGRSSR